MPIVAGDMYIENGDEPTPDQDTLFLSTVNADPTLHGVFMYAADDTQTTPELWQAFSLYPWNGGVTLPPQPIAWGQVKTPLGLYIRATPSGNKLGALSKASLVPIWYIDGNQWAAITTAHDQWVYVGNSDYITWL